ncbi:MAG: efflux RND transporter periplasmic adaptor subunit [Thalassotalea sp.]|nr:efflux RND transporter periplasmic adaptor subunit [Thalassotalea sp.]
MKTLNFSAIVRTISVIGFGLIAFTSQGQQGRAANVNVANIESATLSPIAWVPGTVVSRNNSQIAADVSGRLVSLANLGSQVKKDQIIAQLDDRSLTLKYDEEAAQVANAQAKLKFETSELTRKKSLIEKKLISEKELEEAMANLNIAQANLAAAKAKLEQIAQDITYTKLKAPFDGIVVERLSNQGEYVNNGNAIIRLVETANVEASLFAPLTAYRFLKESKKLAIKSPLGEGKADIKAVIPVADSRSQLMEVRLDMSSFDWPIGLDLKAAIATGNSKQVLAVPRDALVLRRNATSIFVIDDENKAKQITVSLGISEGALVEVIGDIQAGDKVVIRGAERLREGQLVNIKTNNDQLISGQSATGNK